MSRIALSNTGTWDLKFSEHDVRGFDALDAEGNRVGKVDNMIVDTDAKRVDAIVLEDGTEYPARDMSIGDGVVYLTTILPEDVAETVTVYDSYGHVIERQYVAEAGFESYADDFRTHYTTAFADTGVEYDQYAPAYRYGYEMASDTRYRDRDFSAVEADLRKGYVDRHDESLWEETKDAVRHAYNSVRRAF